MSSHHSDWPTEQGTRSPFQLFWTAKNQIENKANTNFRWSKLWLCVPVFVTKSAYYIIPSWSMECLQSSLGWWQMRGKMHKLELSLQHKQNFPWHPPFQTFSTFCTFKRISSVKNQKVPRIKGTWPHPLSDSISRTFLSNLQILTPYHSSSSWYFFSKQLGASWYCVQRLRQNHGNWG